MLNKIEKICQLTGIKFEGILFNDLLKALKKWIVKNHPDRTSNLNPQFSEVLKKRQALENFVGQTPSIEDLNKSFNKIMTFKSKLDRAKNN